MVRTYNAVLGEKHAIASFHLDAEKKGITIKKFRLDQRGGTLTIRATEFSK